MRNRFEPPHLSKLRVISLFSTLNRAELRTIDSLLHQRDYIKGEIIFDEGEQGQAVYFILSGKVLICRQGRPVDGAIAELGVGQCFGELALLDDAPRMAQVRAADNCILAALFREDFLGLLQTHAAIASKLSLELARLLGGRLRDTVNRFVV
ncbi:MAG: cyclic nucleotide-binding domain-containing protein [Methylophilaceae bacterium]|nr:cyclic nucleotide-binding domain-containing protein [Methylophilaceae bacterium]